MYDSRASLPKEVKTDIENFLRAARGTNSAWAEAQVLPAFIRRNIKLAEAPSYGKTIFEYEPSCNGAQDYQQVAEFLLGKPVEPEQLESLESTETEEIQENSEQPEYETSQPYPVQEQSSEPEEPTPQEDFYQQHNSSEYTEPAETTEIQDNLEQPQNETPPYSIQEQSSEQAEPTPQEDFQNQQQGDYSSDLEEKPPFEIREIPPSGHQEYEQYTQTPEEQNQPENHDQGDEPEHRDF
jgi:hypothetical protein